MDMAAIDEPHTLGEIARALQDFRSELRGALNTVVRQDVYTAQQATLRAEMATMKAAYETEAAAMRLRVEALEADKRQNKGLAWSAIASAAVAIVLWLVKAN